MKKIGGVFYLKVDGRMLVTTEDDFTVNLGRLKKQAEKSGSGKVAGYSAEAQIPYIEGEIYLTQDVDIEKIIETDDAEITVEFYNGKTFVLTGATYCGEGDFTTKGKFKLRFEGTEAELV